MSVTLCRQTINPATTVALKFGLYECGGSQLPSDMSIFPLLEVLRVPQISGSFPPLNTFAQPLRVLELYDSRDMTGPIPDFLSWAGTLEELHLWNVFEGAVSQFSGLVNLRALTLRSWDYTAQPPDVSGMPNLEHVNFSLFPRSFPDTLLSRPNLKSLSTAGFRIAGTFPELSNWPLLEKLELQSTQYSSPFPDWSGHINMKHISVSDYTMTGTLASLQNMPDLEILQLEELNTDVGPLLDWSMNTKLREIVFACDNRSGTIPDWSNHPDLERIQLISVVRGTIPDWSSAANLQLLNIKRHTQLTGTIPDWSASTKLRNVDLARNQLTGTIPPFHPQNIKLSYLELYENQLTGTIPDLSQFPELADVELNDNRLTGTLPAAWLVGDSDGLDIDLSNNQLTGSIATLPFQGVNLDSLYLAGNNFSCPIPNYNAISNRIRGDYDGNAPCIVEQEANMRYNGPVLEESLQPTQNDCQQRCDNHKLCAGWTWWPHSSWCMEHLSPGVRSATNYASASAGSANNPCQAQLGSRYDLTDGHNTILSQPSVTDVHGCCDACLIDGDCVAFQYKSPMNKCVLLDQADGATLPTNRLSFYGTA